MFECFTFVSLVINLIYLKQLILLYTVVNSLNNLVRELRLSHKSYFIATFNLELQQVYQVQQKQQLLQQL